MTETSEANVVNEALVVIDKELLRLASRDMVTASDVTNMLLDLRLLLSPGAESGAAEAVATAPSPLPA